jgi:hypothetical protein
MSGVIPSISNFYNKAKKKIGACFSKNPPASCRTNSSPYIGNYNGQPLMSPPYNYEFGKKRKGCKSTKKLSAKIRNLCRRLKIKTTKKVGKRRVCKPMKLIMKQIKKKMRKVRRTRRRSGFGW